ncbi:MAG: beta,4-mannooligosaccharide/beta,4-mannosyl-N-acetylglucosamine phosphorylase [Gaiellaceae bacterium]|nr:beta,4-mannooligosaccharide/beta,4-mannosyl-N-acetylglucosamine phosphorylase [Gaiellaceae bacterium]
MTVRELFSRHPANPILTAEDWPYPVNAVFNPAAATVDGETILLARVEDRRGISHLSVARSSDGVRNWTIDPVPFLEPDGSVDEQWGFEDARVVWVDELRSWMITCTAYGPSGPAVYLASTEDFVSVERRGIIQHPEDKNAALFSNRIDGRWVLLHRPTTHFGGGIGSGEIALSHSDDLISWGARETVLSPREGAWWDSLRIGIGPPPLRTEHGWLLLYHGVKQTVSGGIYRVGAALLDLDDPTRVLHRLPSWVLSPTAPYERVGDIPNVVFPCGLLHDEAAGELRLYYGAADTSIALATAKLSDVLDALLAAS